MKKLITLAIAAFLFGAFSVANAQQPTPIVKGDKTNDKKAVVNTTKEIDAKTTLKEAEVKTTLKEAEAKTTLKEANEFPVSPVIIKKESTEAKIDWDMELKNYEIAVDQCITLYKATKVQKDEKALEKALAEFNNKLDEVEAMGSKIEKAKDELNRTQLHRYREAKTKLAVVYQKG